MAIHETLKKSIPDALRAHDEVRLRTLRSLVTAMTNEVVAKKRKPDESLTDEEALAVLKRASSQRKDSIEQFEKASRNDLAEPEKLELTIIESYLPQMMSRDEIMPIAKAKMIELNLSPSADSGKLIGALMKELKGKADGALVKDGLVSPDGYLINNLTPEAAEKAPLQTMPHIGNRLDAAGVSWAWYSGGSTIAQRPYVLFRDLATGTPGAQHIKGGEDQFVADLKGGGLPQVAFMKPQENEHPKESQGLIDGDKHVVELILAVQESPYWKSSVIVVTYDEGHSFWDHVAPPVVDRWGPGRRVPAIVISPFAKKKFVDHTRYDTTSILKLIETRFGLEPLGPRDAAAADLTAALKLT